MGARAFGPAYNRVMHSRTLALAVLAVFLVACPTTPEVESIEPVSASVTCVENEGAATWDVQLIVDGPATDDGAEFEIRTTDVPNPEPYDLALIGRNGDRNVEYGGTFAGDPMSTLETDVPFDCTVTDPEIILCVVNREDSASSCWACGDDGTLPGQARGWISCD